MVEVTLQEILAELSPLEVSGINPAQKINKITNNSKEVEPGSLFIAIKGDKFDGHQYLDEVLAKGAEAVVVAGVQHLEGRTGIAVENTRFALSKICAAFYRQPSKQLGVVGLTGTNGKTTTNWMIYNLLLELGGSAARIGTLGMEYFSPSRSTTIEGNLTTPDAIAIHRDLREFVDHKVKYAALEVSSHALDQHRVEDLHFDVAIYTNLTRDHLDYHQDMKNYFNAKAHLFELLARSEKKSKTAIINIDCQYGSKMLEYAKKMNLPCLTIGKSLEASFSIESCEQSLTGSKLGLKILGKQYEIQSPFIGYHNAENLCAALASAVSLGFELDTVLGKVSSIPQVPGRLESVGDSKVGIFVDYAHTPDALQNVLESLKPLVRGKLWVVFGCGGDRDKGKRPEMAKITERFADQIIVTSDNPRTEDPERIIDDIMASGVNVYAREADRQKAIQMAVREAEEGDIVLIAGKGHENYQIIGTEKIHFSDVEEVEKAKLSIL